MLLDDENALGANGGKGRQRGSGQVRQAGAVPAAAMHSARVRVRFPGERV